MRVAMIGPRLQEPGGISNVASVLLSSSAWEDTTIDYFPSTGGIKPLETIRDSSIDFSRFLRAIAQGYRADLYHIHGSYGYSFWREFFFIQSLKATGARVVLHIHGSRFADHYNASRLYAAATRKAFRQVDRVVCLSHDFERLVLGWMEGDVSTTVLPNPVPVHEFLSPDRQYSGHRPVVLFMGAIGSRKGCWDLLEAARRVIDVEPEVLFRFGGSGETERLQEDARRLGIQDHVELLGWIGGDDRKKAYAQADIFCLPSYRECLPCSILEAMSAGIPVVSTRVAGIPEAVVEGRTGLLVEPGDRDSLASSLIQLIRSESTRREFGLAGLERARAVYDLDKVVGAYLKLWRQVVS